jgi:hypothetical protein
LQKRIRFFTVFYKDKDDKIEPPTCTEIEFKHVTQKLINVHIQELINVHIPVSLDSADEKLRTIGVWACVGHGKDA